MVFVALLNTTVPVQTDLHVHRVRFQDTETREYLVEGGLGTRCSFVATFRLDCGLEEFYEEFSQSQLHRAVSITSTSICITKQEVVPWMMFEAWLGTVMQRHLFPNRSIRFIDKGIASKIPKYHLRALTAQPSGEPPEEK